MAPAVIAVVGEKCQAAARDGDWRSFKLNLRFMACLQPLLEGDGVFPLLEELFDKAVDLQTASSEDVSCIVFRLGVQHSGESEYLVARY